MERQLAVTENIQTALEKKLAESSKKELEQRVLLDAANCTVADVCTTVCVFNAYVVVENSIKYKDCIGGNRAKTADQC